MSSGLEYLEETNQKVQSGVTVSVQDYFDNDGQFDPTKDRLDFLHVKNTLLLSYLIDLTFRLKSQLEVAQSSDNDDERRTEKINQNRERLMEMKTILEKTRGLDKKLRYQIDKLLQAENSSATAFASSEDPLQFRPNPKALQNDDSDGSSSSDASESDLESDDDKDNSDDDDDLQAAKRTLARAQTKSASKKDNEEGVYRPPRLQSTPYVHDNKEEKQAEKEKRRLRRLKTSELAQALRTQYGEAPDQEDIHGGYGLQEKQASKRMAERLAEKTKYEEEQMVRLVTTRKEKKERKRLRRQEESNLSTLADIGSLIRDSEQAMGGRKKRGNDEEDGMAPFAGKRHSNGKRVKEQLDSEGRLLQKKKGGLKAKNSFQAELYGGNNNSGSKKRKKSKR